MNVKIQKGSQTVMWSREVTVDSQLPFLDIHLNREEDESISTSVYRKATHTDQYLCFHSHRHAAHKRAVVRTLMCRAEALSLSEVSRVQEENLVSQALQEMVTPRVSYTSIPAHSLISRLHVTRWPMDL